MSGPQAHNTARMGKGHRARLRGIPARRVAPTTLRASHASWKTARVQSGGVEVAAPRVPRLERGHLLTDRNKSAARQTGQPLRWDASLQGRLCGLRRFIGPTGWRLRGACRLIRATRGASRRRLAQLAPVAALPLRRCAYARTPRAETPHATLYCHFPSPQRIASPLCERAPRTGAQPRSAPPEGSSARTSPLAHAAPPCSASQSAASQRSMADSIAVGILRAREEGIARGRLLAARAHAASLGTTKNAYLLLSRLLGRRRSGWPLWRRNPRPSRDGLGGRRCCCRVDGWAAAGDWRGPPPHQVRTCVLKRLCSAPQLAVVPRAAARGGSWN